MEEKLRSILGSLKKSPLLVGDLSKANTFDRELLGPLPRECDVRFSQKLGHLYEEAVGVLIDTSSGLDCMARNLQVFDSGGRTIGELDFVVYDIAMQQHIHLELAVKFYLAVCSSSGWKFPGPDPKDNWKRKLLRMRSHQLAICARPEVKELLHDRFGIVEIATEQLIYGCLFTPINCAEDVVLEGMSPNARRGHWLFISEWEEYFSGLNEVRLIPKYFWAVEIGEISEGSLELISLEKLKRLALERCTMFIVEGDTVPYFLVPDEWIYAVDS